jgi:hypothetical protein
MPNSRYQKGRRGEYLVMRPLEGSGLSVRAGSRFTRRCGRDRLEREARKVRECEVWERRILSQRASSTRYLACPYERYQGSVGGQISAGSQ